MDLYDALIMCISVGCILRIKQKTQMLLEAKIGSYKIFDSGLRSLIDHNGWVTDEVSLCSVYPCVCTHKENYARFS